MVLSLSSVNAVGGRGGSSRESIMISPEVRILLLFFLYSLIEQKIGPGGCFGKDQCHDGQ